MMNEDTIALLMVLGFLAFMALIVWWTVVKLGGRDE